MKDAIFAAALWLLATAAEGDERPVPLIDAPGRDAVENNCAACHSLDYVRTDAPFMGRNVWQAEVDKMIKVFGAPIEPNDARVIVDYLVQHYGTGE